MSDIPTVTDLIILAIVVAIVGLATIAEHRIQKRKREQSRDSSTESGDQGGMPVPPTV